MTCRVKTEMGTGLLPPMVPDFLEDEWGWGGSERPCSLYPRQKGANRKYSPQAPRSASLPAPEVQPT